jgi:UPF0755 protein
MDESKYQSNIQNGSALEAALSKQSRTRILTIGLILSLVMASSVSALLFLHNMFTKPKESFPVHTPITIEAGSSVASIVTQLKHQGVVSYEFPLYLVLIWKHDPTAVKASTYYFDQPLDVYQLAERLVEGDYANSLVRFTHLEGMSVRALAPTITTVFPNISVEAFSTFATPFEGTLFPDTYLVPPTIALDELVQFMIDRHNEVMTELLEAHSTTMTIADIIIIASLLEREANSPESMHEVANIIKRRLAIGMPLQVDASMEYVLDKPLGELLADDLRIESPYNTYLNQGLPPTPIGNPGKVALEAAITATGETPYLFYITGNDGKFYYGRNFDEHRQNIARYLR